MGRSRRGLTSKIHAVVDTNGLPVHLVLTPGEAHNNRLCSVLLSALLPQTMLLADRGHDPDWIRELARQQGAWANIPPKRNRKDHICFIPYLSVPRAQLDRTVFQQDQAMSACATRYDKLAANYLGPHQTHITRIRLRANEQDHDLISSFGDDLRANASRLSRGKAGFRPRVISREDALRASGRGHAFCGSCSGP